MRLDKVKRLRKDERNVYRKKSFVTLGLAFWGMAALTSGCRRYEPYEVQAAVITTGRIGAGQQPAENQSAGVRQVVNYSGGPGAVAQNGAGQEAAASGQTDGASGQSTARQAEALSNAGQEAPKETSPSFTDVDETVYVTATSVNVRASWSTSSEIVGVLYRGEAVKRTGTSQEWSRVVYKDQQRYIASQYLSASQPETAAAAKVGAEGEVRLNSSWKYAEFSKINSGAAKLYKASGSNRKGITVCINAGHGTSGGGSVKTLCHPDGTAKVTGGTTAAGATTAAAVSSGMTFADGTAEPKVTLALAKKLKSRLLEAGYDVLMIRESDDVQLDNVARTVIANNAADCHIALHWDSTTNNKGAFYMSVPGNDSYRNMEPVKSHWQQHNALGESLIGGLKGAGVKIFSGGSMEMDLTQTSYSTVPSVDIELGDKASDHSDGTLETLAGGLLAGINAYFGQ